MVDSFTVESAILKTLIYADLFDYPLKAWEIHKWLISKKGSLRQVEKTLKSKSLASRIKSLGGYYFLEGRENLVRIRKNREGISKGYMNSAKLVSFFFKLIPWIKLIGISGSLSLKNSQKKDDIDFFIITSSGRLWLSRILLLGFASIMGKRRKRGEKTNKVSGKYCINILLEESNLAQQDKNIYLAHEILQMDVLHQKDGTYQKYLEDNSWAFKYLPNWISGESQVARVKSQAKKQSLILDFLENLVKDFQLKYMGKPKGEEKILGNALYFLPINKQTEILKEYQKRLKKFKIT